MIPNSGTTYLNSSSFPEFQSTRQEEYFNTKAHLLLLLLLKRSGWTDIISNYAYMCVYIYSYQRTKRLYLETSTSTIKDTKFLYRMKNISLLCLVCSSFELESREVDLEAELRLFVLSVLLRNIQPNTLKVLNWIRKIIAN